MKTTLELSTDEYDRKILSGRFIFNEDVKLLLFAWFQDKLWWVKTSEWRSETNYRVMYHHCHNGDRQVQVMPQDFAFIQDCIIPEGNDPESSQDSEIALLTPSVLYETQEHGLGVIAFPHGSVKTLRNAIWRLKPEYYNSVLKHFEPALSKTRHGCIAGFMPYQALKTPLSQGSPE